MKNNYFLSFVITSAIVLLLVTASLLGISDVFTLLALPFTFLGDGLRALSLSGDIGNVIAIITYALVSLSPLLLLIHRKLKNKDILIFVCTGLMFYVLYYMINPALRPEILCNEIGNFIMAGTVYSVLLCWLILNVIDSLKETDTNIVYDMLRIFLFICIAGFTAGIIFCIGDYISSLYRINIVNTNPNLSLIPTYIFAFITSAITILEYLIDIRLLYLSSGLLRELRADAYSKSCYNSSKKLSHWCNRGIIILIVTTTTLNIGQILFAPFLYNIDFNLHLPVFSLILSFALMAITRILYQGKTIKEDNDLFV